MSVFRLQIVDDKGVVANLNAGGQLETDLVEEFTNSILSEMSIISTTAKRKDAIRNGIIKSIKNLKNKSVGAIK